MNELIEHEIRHAIAQGGPTSHLLSALRTDLAAAQARLEEAEQERLHLRYDVGALNELFNATEAKRYRAETTLAAIRTRCIGIRLEHNGLYGQGHNDALDDVLALLDANKENKS